MAYIRRMIPSAVRRIFLLPPTAFFCMIGRDPFRLQGGDFSRHIGWEWGKIPTWWEKFLLRNGTWSEKLRHSWKNFDMDGKIPTWSEKKTGRINLFNYNSILSFSVPCHTCDVLVLLSFLLCPCPFVCPTTTLSFILSQIHVVY